MYKDMDQNRIMNKIVNLLKYLIFNRINFIVTSLRLESIILALGHTSLIYFELIITS